MELRRPNIKFSREELKEEQVQKSVIFEKDTNKWIQKLLKAYDVLDINSSGQIWAVKGDLRKSGMMELFGYMSSWDVLKLYIWSNREEKLLKVISSIDLMKLKQIHVGWNKIQSIEGLQRLKMPNIKQIVLRDNLINSVSSMRKLSFPQLTEICLRGNPIKQASIQCLFSSVLCAINLNQTLLYDQRRIFKLESLQMKTIRFKNGQSLCRIRSYKLSQKFGRLKVMDLGRMI